MTLTITLDDATEQEIERKAARLGISAAEYVQRLAVRSARPKASSNTRKRSNSDSIPMTPADSLKYWRENGLLGSYGDPAIDAPELARILRAQMESRS